MYALRIGPECLRPPASGPGDETYSEGGPGAALSYITCVFFKK